MTRRVIFFIVSFFSVCLPAHAEEGMRLPYATGESMLVSRGYDTPATHLHKDRYALDFVQGGCKSYGREVRAIRSGVVSFINTKDTWGGGYGKNIILEHDDARVSRYAHLSAYAKNIEKGVPVSRGQTIGYQGNTGNVLGVACKEHPGTHLHLSVLENNLPIKPEPMSSYEEFFAGNWYLSDNVYPDPGSGLQAHADELPKKDSVSWISLLLQKLRSFFHTNTSSNETQTRPVIEQEQIQTIVKNVEEEKENIALKGIFESEDVQIRVPIESSEITTIIRVKNTGAVSWPASSVSLHIVGEEKTVVPFYHPSWITAARPAIVLERVLPNTWTDIPFIIHVPEHEYETQIQFTLEHGDGKQFSRVSTNAVTVHIVRFTSQIESSVSLSPDSVQEMPLATPVTAVPLAASLYIPEVHHHGFSLPTVEPEIVLASAPTVSTPLVVASVAEETSTEVVASTSTIESATTTVTFSFATSTRDTEMSTTTPPFAIHEDIAPLSTVSSTVPIVTSTDSFATSTQEQTLIDNKEKREIPLYCGVDNATKTGSLFISEEQYIDTRIFDDRDHVVLTKEQGPYIFDIDTHIPQGKTLRIEDGTVLMGMMKQAVLTVEGTLLGEGSEEKPIEITSICNGSEQPGDWSHIHIAPSGMVQLTHVNIAYGGYPFSISSGTLASTYQVSRLFFNQGGSLVLDHVAVTNSYVKTADERFNAYIWIEHAEGFVPNIRSEHSSYSDGYTAMHIEGKNNNQYIGGRFIQNTCSRFTSPFGPVSFYRDMPFIDGLIFNENINNAVYINDVHIIDSVQWQKDMVYLLSGMTIEKNATLFVPAGVQFRMFPGTDVFVSGTLIMEGTDDHPIIIQPDSTKWGSIIFSNGKGVLSGVDMSGGGLSQSTPSGQSRMIYGVDSDIGISNSVLRDSRIPGALVEVEQSALTVTDNIFSWTSPPLVSSWITYGIFMDGGEISMENNFFHNVVMPFYATEKTIIKETEKVSQTI